jgi:hypothetical protein
MEIESLGGDRSVLSYGLVDGVLPQQVRNRPSLVGLLSSSSWESAMFYPPPLWELTHTLYS